MIGCKNVFLHRLGGVWFIFPSSRRILYFGLLSAEIDNNICPFSCSPRIKRVSRNAIIFIFNEYCSDVIRAAHSVINLYTRRLAERRLRRHGGNRTDYR